MGKAPLPTDLEMLDCIYDRYYETFAKASHGDGTRETKIYVPIDIEAIASALQVDPDLVFGRLYYYLDKKYGYSQPGGGLVPLFSRAVGSDKNCVHFPLLGAVLAEMRNDERRHQSTTTISVVSLVVSVIAIVVSLFRTVGRMRVKTKDAAHSVFWGIVGTTLTFPVLCLLYWGLPRSFWDDFWPGTLATIVGILLGLPASLWVERFIERRTDEKQQRASTERLRDALRALREAFLTMNRR